MPDAVLDYPILHDLRAQGCTDYVAMPFVFSSGQINVLSLATQHPGGFSTENLGQIHEVLPVLTRIFEVHAMRSTAVQLLDVYLGKQSGAKVLDGRVKRGDGEEVHAVIWFSDLRGSTGLADAMPRREFLSLLDDFFDCTAGAVLQHGGEVLRFIGDASLAIFPISRRRRAQARSRRRRCAPAKRRSRPRSTRTAACARATNAAAATRPRSRPAWACTSATFSTATSVRTSAWRSASSGRPPTRPRALRRCASRSAPRHLVSSAFARHLPARLRPLGRHLLRGVAASRRYTLAH